MGTPPQNGISSVRLLRPATTVEACTMLADLGPSARPLAGGTALVVMMQQGLVAPDALVLLQGIPGLAGVGVERGSLVVGSGTRLADVAASPAVRAARPSLAAACAHVGNVRIRNAATLGGNVAEADYASDPPAVLAALGASYRVIGAGGERTVPAAAFATGWLETVLAPDELVVEVHLPMPQGEEREAYARLTSRSLEDRPCVGVAAWARLDRGVVQDLRVVVGAATMTPQSLVALAAAAHGRRFDDGLARELAALSGDTVQPITDVAASAWYRSRLVPVLVHRVLARMIDGRR